MLLFKRKGPDIVECINFNGQDVSTGAVGAYIVSLYKFKGLKHLGFTYRKESDGTLRFAIYCLRHNTQAIRYFKDRCPAMVENECLNFKKPLYTFKLNTWGNGFVEVVETTTKEE